MPKVLIVDDDEEIRVLLAEFLSEQGYLVRLACHGLEAVEILQHEAGWVILLDWNMPQLDGAGVLEQVAETPALQLGNTIILLSATARFHAQQLARWSGLVAATLEKPFELDEVLAAVQGCGR
jgi:CheY-like chemotaxis protein